MVSAAHRSCPACSDARGEPAGAENGFDLMRCARCGTLFTTELPSPGDAEDYAAYYHESNLDVPSFVDLRLDALVAGMDPHRRTGRWLDVGFGAGALLRAGARRGWAMTGTEVSDRALEAVSDAGFDVRGGSLAEVESDSFDVVTVLEVLEHVPEPGALLREAGRVLRPGGVLYVTTPNARGLSSRCLGLRWSVVCPPEHLQLFSLAGLRALCAAAGIRVRSVRAHGVNPYELAVALPRRRAKLTGDERVAGNYRLNDGLARGRRRMLAKEVVNGALSVTRLGDTLKLEAECPA